MSGYGRTRRNRYCSLANTVTLLTIPRSSTANRADEICTRCRACMDRCPPQAIGDAKVLVRGVERWYVDFDRCLPFFNEHQGCAICLSVCPWNYPGVAPNLLQKLAARAATRGTPPTT